MLVSLNSSTWHILRYSHINNRIFSDFLSSRINVLFYLTDCTGLPDLGETLHFSNNLNTTTTRLSFVKGTFDYKYRARFTTFKLVNNVASNKPFNSSDPRIRGILRQCQLTAFSLSKLLQIFKTTLIYIYRISLIFSYLFYFWRSSVWRELMRTDIVPKIVSPWISLELCKSYNCVSLLFFRIIIFT